MDTGITETHYPLIFRQKDAKALGNFLQNAQSVQLIGMKRIGIGNFLRFFLYHKDIKKQYMPQDGKILLIPVDLNNLIEREIFPFWRLTFKRIVDAVENASVAPGVKQKIADLFLASIQSGDLFLTFDGVRASLSLLVEAQLYPTLFFIRFDRLKDAVTLEFFNNLQALLDSTNQKLSYVFTSYRDLSVLSPQTFPRHVVQPLLHTIYMQPAKQTDMETIFTSSISENLSAKITPAIKDLLIDLSGGHTQYLHLSLVVLREIAAADKTLGEDMLIKAIESDERVNLLSEELWESLTPDEQEIIKKVNEDKKITASDREKGKYLWNTGFIQETHGMLTLFSPLFALFVENIHKRKSQDIAIIEFSKKEHMLFELLKAHPNAVVEREKIIEIVWPEYKEYGVSDWSVDRLVARVRGKLKKQKGDMEIVTVRTRGYKLLVK